MTEKTEATNYPAPDSLASEPESAAKHNPATEESESMGVLISRMRASDRFLPRPSPQAGPGTVVGRGFLASKSAPQRQQISRERQIAGDLPMWEPLPPGEVAVRRRVRD